MLIIDIKSFRPQLIYPFLRRAVPMQNFVVPRQILLFSRWFMRP